MTSDSNKYEKFITKLVDDISTANRDIQNLGSGAKFRPKGALGQRHQIDVAFIDKSFPTPKLIIIECKLKNPKYHVGPEVVKILAFNGFDLSNNSKYPKEHLLIVCSTSDFTSGAKRLAEALDIKLERVSFSPDYTFRYENIVLAAVNSDVAFADQATCTVRHVDGTES